MHITLIAAVSENGVIGRAGGLPWKLRDDLRRFKQRTLGHAVIMGRKTYESVGAPLIGRENIVVTSNPSWSAPGIIRAGSIAGAVDHAVSFEQTHHPEDPEVFIIGGAQIYAESIALATRLDLTLVHATVEGDARFPEVDWSGWSLVESEDYPASPPQNEYAFTFRVFERAEGAGRAGASG